MVMNTTLCFMWGYSIGLNFKRQTSDHCMRTNYRGSWFPLFFLTNLLTWNLKCKFANQPSTFCQHREKTIYWIESCCGLCGPAKTLEPITGTITDVFLFKIRMSFTDQVCLQVHGIWHQFWLLCNSQCVKEQDGSAKDWKNKKCSYCGIYITPILLLLITKNTSYEWESLWWNSFHIFGWVLIDGEVINIH